MTVAGTSGLEMWTSGGSTVRCWVNTLLRLGPANAIRPASIS